MTTETKTSNGGDVATATDSLTVTDNRSSKAKIHSAAPPITPTMAGAPGGGAILKWALTMALNRSGTVRAGTRLWLIHGGVARTTASARETIVSPSPTTMEVTRSSLKVRLRIRRPR